MQPTKYPFTSNQTYDVLLFSGVNWKPDIDSFKRNHKELKSEAVNNAFEMYKDNFVQYKAALAVPFDQMVSVIDSNWSQRFSQLDPSINIPVANKLRELSGQHISKNESQMSFITKLFHKIGQVFKGHGFRTQGEYGLLLADRLTATPKVDLEKFFTPYLTGLASPYQEISVFMPQVNALNEKKFDAFLKTVFFKGDGMTVNNHKWQFFLELSPKKKEQLVQVLVTRDQWIRRLLFLNFSMKDKVAPNFWDPILTEALVNKLKENPEGFLEEIRSRMGLKNEHVALLHHLLKRSLDDQDAMERFVNASRAAKVDIPALVSGQAYNFQILNHEEIQAHFSDSAPWNWFKR